MWLSFATGALLAAVSIGHCASMCGPLAVVSCPRRDAHGLWRYQLGRTAGYVFCGALAAELGAGISLIADAAWASWLFSAVAAAGCIAAARRIAGVGSLVQLRRAGERSPALWARVARLLPQDPLPLGLLSSVLPCGLLMTAWLAAAATRQAAAGAALMLGFVTVSGAAVMGTGFVVTRLARAPRWLRQVTAGLLVVAAGLIVSRPIAAALRPETGPRVPSGPLCHGGMRARD
jgi:sulfite exporter TauE/SafE